MSSVRTHQILGWVAIGHAAVLSISFFWMFLSGSISWIENDLWVGFATLWLFWPIILSLHTGRSLARVAIPLLVSVGLLFLCRSIREYPQRAPHAFGLPEGVYLSPRSIINYFAGYRAGRVDAQQDLDSGRLVIETYGFPMPREYREILQQRYKIELRTIAGDVNVPDEVRGHAAGYNQIAELEVKRRFGAGVLKGAEEEAMKLWRKALPNK